MLFLRLGTMRHLHKVSSVLYNRIVFFTCVGHVQVSPRCLIKDRRQFSKVTDSQATELYFEEIFEQGFASGDPLFDLRNYFYPESEDPYIDKLSNAGCVDEVLEIVTKQVKNVDHRHLTQAVATLHHMQKLCLLVGQANFDDEYRKNTVTFNSQLREDPKYKELLNLIQSKIHEIPHHELAFLLMCLRKFQEPLSSDVIRDIFILLQKNMDNLDMECLSYLSVGLRPRFFLLDDCRQVWRMAMAQSLPRLQYWLLNCSNPEELKRIAICFTNMASIISDRMMDQLREKVTSMIVSDQLSKLQHLPVLLKLIALVINKANWHDENGDYVYLLTTQFQGKTQFLRPEQVLMLCRVLSNYGEPTSLYYEVYQRIVDIISNKQFHGHVPLISCLQNVIRINNNAIPLKEVETILEDLISSHHLTDHISEVYDIMRSVGTINPALVDRFFENAYKCLEEDPYELLRFATRYINFYSQYTGHYKNTKFEQKMTETILSNSMCKTNTKFLRSEHPSVFANKIGLLLNFGYKLDDFIFDRLDDYLPNMRPDALLSISRGIQPSMYRESRKTNQLVAVPSKKRTVYLDRLEELSVKIAEKSLEHVKYITNNKDKKTVGETLFLFKNYTNRCDLFDESHYRQVLDVLTEKISSGQVTTHSVKEICSAITTTRMNMANPSLMNAIIQFFMSRPDPKELHINILYKSVIACSRTGQELPPEFLDVVSHCLNRDIDSVPGLLSLQVAQAICTYGDPGRELITSLFSNEFMQKLDNEVQMSGDRNNYPRLVRSNLMELNRAVVLRYPQYGVPWFHQKYCLENHQQMLGNNGTKSSNESFVLRQEVYEHLCSVLNGWRFVKEDVTSRYFNNIDFEVAYDHNGRPVDLISNPNVEPAKRIAVMVLPTTSYTVDTKQIMNKERVLMRELELEGWNVIIVDPFIWNSMQLTEASAKRNYLLTCLNDVMGPELKTQTRSYP